MTLAERLFRLTTSGVKVAPVFDGRSEYGPGRHLEAEGAVRVGDDGLLLGAGERDGDAGRGEEAGERDAADDREVCGYGALDLLGGVVVCGGAVAADGDGDERESERQGDEVRGRSRDSGRSCGTGFHGCLLGYGFVRRRRLPCVRGARCPRCGAVQEACRGCGAARTAGARGGVAGGAGWAGRLSTGAPQLVDGETTTAPPATRSRARPSRFVEHVAHAIDYLRAATADGLKLPGRVRQASARRRERLCIFPGRTTIGR